MLILWINVYRLVRGDVTFASPYEPGALPLDSFQNKRFKLIPMIVDGPWMVKMAVRYVNPNVQIMRFQIFHL
jgi:hypothetical protein